MSMIKKKIYVEKYSYESCTNLKVGGCGNRISSLSKVNFFEALALVYEKALLQCSKYLIGSYRNQSIDLYSKEVSKKLMSRLLKLVW